MIDDDPSVRRSLVRLLTSVGLESESYATATEFLEREPPGRPCCLVLDVRLPGLSGLDLQEQLADRGFEAAIVFLTGHATVSMGVGAMKRGAVDFLEKPFDEAQLLTAIDRALGADAKRRTAQEGLEKLGARWARLTPRERQVFELVASGLLNKQVASRLGTSVKTVKVHRGRVMRKMGAESLADLVKMNTRIARPGSGTTKVP